MHGKMVTAEERRLIQKMKREGFSIHEISIATGRSKSTISVTNKGIQISSQFYDLWKSKRGGSSKKAKERREKSYEHVRRIIGDLHLRDHLLIAACLYWAEGNKIDFSLSNTDPRLIKTFLDCLLKLGVTKDRLKVSIRLYEDLNEANARRYWAQITGINPKEIHSVNILAGKKKGKLRYGMCRIRLRKGNDYFNLLGSTIKLISENLVPVAQWTEQWTPKP